MSENLMLDELDDEMLDFSSNVPNSDVEKVDSILIKKILSEMKCEFNRTNNNPRCNDAKDLSDSDPCVNSSEVEPEVKDEPREEETDNPDISTSGINNDEVEEEAAPKEQHSESVISKSNDNFVDDDTVESYQTSDCIQVTASDNTVQEKVENTVEHTGAECLVEDTSEKLVDDSTNLYTESNSPPSTELEEVSEIKRSRRSSRATIQSDCEVNLKRSSRRMSKENSRESVLQTAIALKEKSFSSLQNDDKPQRRSSRLVDSERGLTTRLRNRSLRHVGESMECSTTVHEETQRNFKAAAVDKIPRCSTEEDTEGESKFSCSRSLASDLKMGYYDDELRLQDSGTILLLFNLFYIKCLFH